MIQTKHEAIVINRRRLPGAAGPLIFTLRLMIAKTLLARLHIFPPNPKHNGIVRQIEQAGKIRDKPKQNRLFVGQRRQIAIEEKGARKNSPRRCPVNGQSAILYEMDEFGSGWAGLDAVAQGGQVKHVARSQTESDRLF